MQYMPQNSSRATISIHFKIFVYWRFTNVVQLGLQDRSVNCKQHHQRNLQCNLPLVLQQPNRSEWKRIADDFNLLWNFPYCCGSIDGKYAYLQAPPKSGSTYFCHKKMFSIVLMAICDANYKFLWVDIGAPGSESAGGVLQRSELGLALHNHVLNLPTATNLPNTNIKFPYFFVGDEAFPLGPSLMRPYPGQFLPNHKKVLNYRLSRARRTIENSFGILVARWRIFKKPIQASLETTKSITKACICLHNFIMMSPDSSTYCPSTLIATTNTRQWAKEMEECALGRLQVEEHLDGGSQLRDILATYVMTSGRVHWQQERVNRGRNPHFVG
ncbi:hypothetical protein B566_EDAN018515 [Ephemera danica]|nr:hypothetical protein B566_EDAN018515 [Ephemera danica]